MAALKALNLACKQFTFTISLTPYSRPPQSALSSFRLIMKTDCQLQEKYDRARHLTLVLLAVVGTCAAPRLNHRAMPTDAIHATSIGAGAGLPRLDLTVDQSMAEYPAGIDRGLCYAAAEPGVDADGSLFIAPFYPRGYLLELLSAQRRGSPFMAGSRWSHRQIPFFSGI